MKLMNMKSKILRPCSMNVEEEISIKEETFNLDIQKL